MKTNTQKIHKVADYVVHVVLVLLAFLLLSGLLLSSCAKLAVDTEKPISMSVKMPGTKAVVSNMADFQTQGNFGVFGYKTMENVVTDDAYVVFTNQLVEYTTTSDPTNWTYTPLKYWDAKVGMWYGFIAYAPHSSVDGMSEPTFYKMSNALGNYYSIDFTNIPAWQDAAKGIDYMVSDPSNGKGADYVNNSNCTVNLTFRHILALIDLKGYVADQQPYVISNISVGSTDVDGRKVPNASDNAYGQRIQYDSDNNLIGPHVTLGAKGVAVWHTGSDFSLDGRLSEFSNPEEPVTICSKLAFPFEVDKLYIKLNFSRNGVADEVEKPIDLSNIESGKHYTIILKFEGGDIVDINVSEVQTWNVVNANHGVYNW